MSRKGDPIEEVIERLDHVLNDPELSEEDLPEVQEIIKKLQEIGERNPMVGFTLA